MRRKGSEVLSKLLPGCSNSGGFRKVMRKDVQIAGLCSFVYVNAKLEWPDYLDEETGIFRYYGITEVLEEQCGYAPQRKSTTGICV